MEETTLSVVIALVAIFALVAILLGVVVFLPSRRMTFEE